MPIVAKSARPAAPAAVINRPEINPPPRRRAPQPQQVHPASEPKPGPESDDYIGYKHPPKRNQFQKGRSGNPKGRPKGAKGIKTIARQVLTEKVSVRTASGVKRMTKMEALIHKNTEMAFAGNIRALLACSSLYQSAVADEVAQAAGTSLSADLTAAGRAILDMFADEVRQEDRDKAHSTGPAASPQASHDPHL